MNLMSLSLKAAEYAMHLFYSLFGYHGNELHLRFPVFIRELLSPAQWSPGGLEPGKPAVFTFSLIVSR